MVDEKRLREDSLKAVSGLSGIIDNLRNSINNQTITDDNKEQHSEMVKKLSELIPKLSDVQNRFKNK